MFKSINFPIENRLGLEDQTIEQVLHQLNDLHAPDVQDSRHDRDSHRRLQLARYLSDWHLVSFLGTSGLFSEVRAPLGS